jgi:hypothetical protein
MIRYSSRNTITRACVRPAKPQLTNRATSYGTAQAKLPRYLAFSTFKLAVILEQIHARHTAGDTLGPRVRRGFRTLRRHLGTPARTPKPTIAGPGRPKGTTRPPRTRHDVGKKRSKVDSKKSKKQQVKG